MWLKHAAARANVQQQFLELPHALRQEVAWELNRALLTRLPLFRWVSIGSVAPPAAAQEWAGQLWLEWHQRAVMRGVHGMLPCLAQRCGQRGEAALALCGTGGRVASGIFFAGAASPTPAAGRLQVRTQCLLLARGGLLGHRQRSPAQPFLPCYMQGAG